MTDDFLFQFKNLFEYCILAGKKPLKYEGNDIQAQSSGDLSEVHTTPPCA
jgi:hypothetical protein